MPLPPPNPVLIGDPDVDVTVTVGLVKLKKVERLFAFQVDGSGNVDHDLILSEAFKNEPETLVVPQAGAGGTYRVDYDSSVPKLNLRVIGDTSNANSIVLLIVIAYDQP